MSNRKFLLIPIIISMSLVCLLSLAGLAIEDTAAAHFQRAVQCRFAGQADAAIAEYKQGLNLDPNSVDGHAQLGILLLEEKGDLDAAISEFLTALSIDPSCKYCDSRLNEALDLKNSKASDQVTRGNMFYGAGELGRAAAAYRIAIGIDQNDSLAHNSLAWTLYRQGYLSEGIREVNTALKLKPQDAEYINTLACLLFDMGDLEGAMLQWRKAISLSKTPNPADLYGLAIGYLLKGDTSDASRYFNDALKIDPHYKDIAYVRDRIGMSVKALATHERLLSLAKDNDQLNK